MTYRHFMTAHEMQLYFEKHPVFTVFRANNVNTKNVVKAKRLTK